MIRLSIQAKDQEKRAQEKGQGGRWTEKEHLINAKAWIKMLPIILAENQLFWQYPAVDIATLFDAQISRHKVVVIVIVVAWSF